MEKQEKKTWGGARHGAGRPKGEECVRTITIRIPADVAEILDAQPKRAAYIIEAIRAYAASSAESV